MPPLLDAKKQIYFANYFQQFALLANAQEQEKMAGQAQSTAISQFASALICRFHSHFLLLYCPLSTPSSSFLLSAP
jgi:hypothetical protein